MKIVGFFVDEGIVISPTIFRELALSKVNKFNLGPIKKLNYKDRADIIDVLPFETQFKGEVK